LLKNAALLTPFLVGYLSSRYKRGVFPVGFLFIFIHQSMVDNVKKEKKINSLLTLYANIEEGGLELKSIRRV